MIISYLMPCHYSIYKVIYNGTYVYNNILHDDYLMPCHYSTKLFNTLPDNSIASVEVLSFQCMCGICVGFMRHRCHVGLYPLCQHNFWHNMS